MSWLKKLGSKVAMKNICETKLIENFREKKKQSWDIFKRLKTYLIQKKNKDGSRSCSNWVLDILIWISTSFYEVK